MTDRMGAEFAAPVATRPWSYHSRRWAENIIGELTRAIIPGAVSWETGTVNYDILESAGCPRSSMIVAATLEGRSWVPVTEIRATLKAHHENPSVDATEIPIAEHVQNRVVYWALLWDGLPDAPQGHQSRPEPLPDTITGYSVDTAADQHEKAVASIYEAVHRGPVKLAELQKETGLSRETINSAVHELVENGIVRLSVRRHRALWAELTDNARVAG
ncbi:MAG: hypothetical protein HUJ16_02880 [Kangiella sp.]|nr:hypothetical protein [Kangiella sp.]